jgi:hypothetical protein
MNKNLIYKSTLNTLKTSHNQPIEMTLADLLDDLEKHQAMPAETIWQMRLAIMHYDQEKLATML